MIGDPESFVWIFVMKQVQVNPFRQPLTPSNKVLDLPMCSNAFIFGMNWRNNLNFTVHSVVEATSISWPNCTHLLLLQILLGTMFQMEAIAAQVKFLWPFTQGLSYILKADIWLTLSMWPLTVFDSLS